MKLTVVIAACMALVAVQAASVQNDPEPGIVSVPEVPVDKAALERQLFFLNMLYRVTEPMATEEWIKLGGQLITDEGKYHAYTEKMKLYASLYRSSQLLPMDQFFAAMDCRHSQESMGLFEFFYFAKDWETLVQDVSWARMNVNPGMFVSALTMAVIHRKDLQGIVLPQIYEIFPQMFMSSKYILAAEKFDWDLWNRQIMLEKELKSIYAKKYPSHLFGKQFYQMSFMAWQWWKLMGLDDGWHLESQSMMREGHEMMRGYTMWKSIYDQLQMVWMPIDYSRDVGIMNDEVKVAYLTEDVGWNAYWYYLNQDYSFLLPSDSYGMDKDRRGEWWIYNVQQLLARYTMERLSQGLGLVNVVPWHGSIRAGYNPQLIAYNGNGFTTRKNNWRVKSSCNAMLLNDIIAMEGKVQSVLLSGQYMMKNGTMLDLTLPESAEFVGDILQGSMNMMGAYPMFPMMASYLAGEDTLGTTYSPNVLLNYETMMRDPVSYKMFQSLVELYNVYKQQLTPYTKKDLLLPGVEIVKVNVSEMKTYFDLVDIDMTNLLNDKMVFHDGKLVWDKVLLGRQMRLNHYPFTYEITVDSKAAQKVVIRAFLGPEFNQYGQRMDMAEHLQYYMEIDEFIYELEAGQNKVERSSEDFKWVSSDRHTMSEIYNYLMVSMEDTSNFLPQFFESHSLFPGRLMLPQGWVEGMPMAMYFMISPYQPPSVQQETYDSSYLSGIGTGSRHIDNMPFGYPLDRPIPNLEEFIVPNMYYKTVMIYHKDTFSKYYPTLYEKFGVFDENF